jgi:enoyl-CoA hydratase/carnithine racemase
LRSYDTFEQSLEDGVLWVTLNRPDRLNALTFGVYHQLGELMGELKGDPEVRVVVIQGKPPAFCSGGDVHDIIGQLFQQDMRGVLEFTRMTGRLVERMRTLDKPIIASIGGIAAGAGSVIALASDFRVLSEKARFAFLFTKVGLAGADMGAAYLLPKLVGLGRATELLLLGDTIDAPTADRYGLAYKVVPEAELEPTVRALATRLANGPLLALSITKEMLNNEDTMDLHSAIEAEAQAQALLLMGKDHREFYDAFVAKRQPVWSGR